MDYVAKTVRLGRTTSQGDLDTMRTNVFARRNFGCASSRCKSSQSCVRPDLHGPAVRQAFVLSCRRALQWHCPSTRFESADISIQPDREKIVAVSLSVPSPHVESDRPRLRRNRTPWSAHFRLL